MRKRYSKKKQSLKRMKRKYTRKGKYSRRMKTGKAGMRRGATPSQDLARYGVEGWCRGEATDSAWPAPPYSARKCNLEKVAAQKQAQATAMPGAVMQPVDEGSLQRIRQKLEDRSQAVLQERIQAGRAAPKETEKEQDERWGREEKAAFKERQRLWRLKKVPKRSAATNRGAAKKKRRKAALPTGKKRKRKGIRK